MRFKDWSYRFAEEVLNSRLPLKQEIKYIIGNIDLDPNKMSRGALNKAFNLNSRANSN